MADKEGHRLGNRFKRKSRRPQIEGCVGESGGGPTRGERLIVYGVAF